MYLVALESVSKTNSTHRPTQVIIAAHNCHIGNTYSPYKHSNVVNILYWILPGGQFAGCSKPIEGCISDRQLLIASGLLPELDEGDHVLMDRGFGNCEDLFLGRMARAHYPPYKPKDGAPFSIKESVRAEAIARARIHIGM